MRASLTLLLSTALLAGGCGFDVGYALHAVTGQLGQSLASVPVEEAIRSGSLSDEQVRKLRLVQEAREFARTQLGLYVENSFNLFYNSGDNPAAINVSASRRDHLEPQLWAFPFVGTLPHLGYFDARIAEAKIDELRRSGLDVYSYEIDAYTNGPPLQNAVLSRMLLRSDEDLVDLVIHELLHSTIWRANDSSFNESLATFVGRFGALRFYESKGDAVALVAAMERYDDRERFRSFMLETYAELEAYYAGPMTSWEKILGRQEIFDAARARFAGVVQGLMHHPARYDFVATLELNNAYLLLFRRYNLETETFVQALSKAGNNWSVAMSIFRAAAAAPGDAFEYVRNWPNVTARVTRQTGGTQHDLPDRACCLMFTFPAED